MVILLALNWLSVLVFQPCAAQPRVTVPFSPYFLTEVQAGTGQVDLVEGRHDPGHVHDQGALPASDKKATPTTLFATQVPTFWNDTQLTALLQEKDVQVNAKSTTTRPRRCWPRSCSASARRC